MYEEGSLESFFDKNTCRLLELVMIVGHMPQTLEMLQEQFPDLSEKEIMNSVTKLICYGLIEHNKTEYWFDTQYDEMQYFIHIIAFIGKVNANAETLFAKSVELK